MTPMFYVHPRLAAGYPLSPPPFSTLHSLAVWIGLAFVILWDVSGGDLLVMRWWGGAAGFTKATPWSALHGAGRVLAWVVLGAMAVDAFMAPFFASRQMKSYGPSPQQRRYAVLITLASIAVVHLIKRASSTSCPWDLTEFGGIATYVSHWDWAQASAGAGHCFPSGHSSAAFCFFTLYFLWQQHDTRRARGYLAAVCTAGVLFSITQIARGAHYPSHVLWSAWICWALPWALMRPWTGRRA